MRLDEIYAHFLSTHAHGGLVTLGPGGAPQVKPVGYRYNTELGSIDVAGLAMERSAKYRNVAAQPRVAFLIEEATGTGPAAMRFLEVRGRAEQTVSDLGPDAEQGLSREIIRIHPRRLVAWNLDPDHPGLRTVDVSDDIPDGVSADRSQGSDAGTPGDDPGRPALDLGDGAAWEARQAAEALAAELQAGFDEADADVSNRHFARDILWGSPFGATVRGYEELHAIHRRLKAQARGGRSSRFEVVNVLAPAPGVAIAQIARLALGEDGEPVEADGDLSGPFSETAMYVLVRRGGAWWLAAGQNTPVLPQPPAR